MLWRCPAFCQSLTAPLVVDPHAQALVPSLLDAIDSQEGRDNTEATLGALDGHESRDNTEAPLGPLDREGLLYLASTRFVDDFIAAVLADPAQEIRQVRPALTPAPRQLRLDARCPRGARMSASCMIARSTSEGRLW